MLPKKIDEIMNEEKIIFTSKGEIANAIQTLTPFALVDSVHEEKDSELKETKKLACEKIRQLIKLI